MISFSQKTKLINRLLISSLFVDRVGSMNKQENSLSVIKHVVKISNRFFLSAFSGTKVE